VSKAGIQTWHARLGHVNKDYIKRTAGAAEGIEITTDEGRAASGGLHRLASNTKSGNNISPLYPKPSNAACSLLILCTQILHMRSLKPFMEQSTSLCW